MEYHKINTVYKRDKDLNLIEGEWTSPAFSFLKDLPWRCTEKVDGTNIRVMWNGYMVTFGGRTDGSQIAANLVNWLTAKFFSPETLHYFRLKFPQGDLTLYGEGFGGEIGKQGLLYSKEVAFTLFDVKVGPWWLEPHNMVDVANHLGLTYVPLWGINTLANAIEAVRSGFESFYGPFKAEGLVCTPQVPLFDRGGARIITKIKTRDFVKATPVYQASLGLVTVGSAE